MDKILDFLGPSGQEGKTASDLLKVIIYSLILFALAIGFEKTFDPLMALAFIVGMFVILAIAVRPFFLRMK